MKLFKVRKDTLNLIDVKRKYSAFLYDAEDLSKIIDIDVCEKNKKYIIKEKLTNRNFSIERIK